MSALPKPAKATRVLVISRGAGSMTPEIEAKLQKAFADHLILDFDPKEDISEVLSPQARVVVAGGDGTVEFFVRKLADSQHPVGIISLGTFNNLARALGLPTELDAAIAVARDGNAKPITLGRVNDHIFVEACAIGLFGETIALGDKAKDRGVGAITPQLRKVFSARRFKYKLSGDLKGSGFAMSLVFSNTSTIGSQIPVGDSTPIQRTLEFSVDAGRTRADIVLRWMRSAILRQRTDDPAGQVFKFSHLEVTTTPKVRVYADNFQVGRTPATITAETSALRVLLPK